MMDWLLRGSSVFLGLEACLLPVLAVVAMADIGTAWNGERWMYRVGGAIVVLVTLTVSCMALWVGLSMLAGLL